MKRGILITSMVLGLTLCSAALAGERAFRAPVVGPWDEKQTLVDYGNAEPTATARSGPIPGLQDAADHIVGQQCGTGAWCWEHGSACCPSPPYSNIVAPIALGLLRAYDMTGDADHLAAAVAGAGYDMGFQYGNGEYRAGSFSAAFLHTLSQPEYTDNSTYSNHAATEFFDELTAGTYGPSNYDTAGWIAAVQAGRTGTWINLRPWEFSTLIHTATAIGNAGQDTLFLNAVLDGLDTLDNTDPDNVYSDLIGLAGGVRGLALSGTTTFTAISSPNHSGINGISTLCDLADALKSYQNADGSWYWHSNLSSPGESDKDTQTTAYAVMALMAAQEEGCGPYDDEIADGRNWLWSMQDTDGGFFGWPGGTHNTEVEGEVLSAMGRPSEVWVDDDYCDGCTNDGHAWGYDAFDNIQDALDAVSGSTVNVAAGLYTIASKIMVNSSVNLVGPQAGVDPRPSASTTRTPGDASEAIIDSGGTLATLLQINANDVTIDGLEFRNGTGDLIQSLAGSGIQNPVLRYNIIHHSTGPGDEGMQIRDAGNAIVEYNHVYSIAQDGINLCCGSTGGTIRYNEVHASSSENAAIYCYDVMNTDILGNLVYDVYNNDGIKLGDSGDGSTGGTVKDNTVHDGAEDGITIYASAVTVENNTIYNCASENGALYLWGADNTTVTRNRIYDNDAIGLLIVNSDNVTVTYNEIYNNDDWDDTKYPGSAGVWCTSDTSGIAVNQNFIYANAGFGLKNEATGTVDAENNWWGDASGPYDPDDDTFETTELGSCTASPANERNADGLGNGIDDTSTEIVDYCPWLTSAQSLTLEVSPGCQGDIGDQLTVELWMRDLTQNVTGFQAFLTYDTSKLTFNAGASSYTTSPFPLNITSMASAEDPLGFLQLDGSDNFGGSGTNLDSLLATLVFDILVECDTSTVDFDLSGPFYSELSYQGVPLPTGLVNTPPVYFDNTPPVISGLAVTGGVVDDDCEFTVTFSATVDDNCCVDVNDVAVGVTLTTGNATLDTPSLTITQNGVNQVLVSGSVLVSGLTSCPATVQVTVDADDCCGNAATQALDTADVNDTTDPVITCPDDITVNADAGGCTATLDFNEPFDTAPPLCATQTPNCWYVDRYAPAAFINAFFDGDNRLKHSISTADSYGNRPAGYQSLFYNTQGRKHDVNMAVGTTLGVDIYIPSDWETDARRADIWATTFDSHDVVSGYPIVGFASNDPSDPVNPNPTTPTPRFRIFTQDTDQDPGNGYTGDWVDLGLPSGFVYDAWYRLEIELTATSYIFTVTAPDTSTVTFTDAITFGSVRFGNVMLQAYNFSDATYPIGDSYDVYWDNCVLGPQGAIATDNCSVATVTYERSDDPFKTLYDPFPSGDTTVTWTATDQCGNAVWCDQTITVNAVNDVELEVELVGVDIPVTRCIHFVTDDCSETADVSLSFVDHDSNLSTPVRFVGTVEIPCGAWTFLCAKDEQHTLWDTTTLTDAGTYYQANTLLSLDGGDTDDDGDVDIHDVTWFLYQYGGSAQSGGCPWDGTRDADFSNNENVAAEDYTFLTSNWLSLTDCACTLLLGPVAGMDALSGVVSVTELPAAVADRADLTGDGVVDYRDVREFELRHGLPHTLSSKMKVTGEMTPRRVERK